MKLVFTVLLLLSFYSYCVVGQAASFSLVTRTIDLSTHLTKQTVVLNLVSPPATIDYTIEEPLASHLSYFRASTDSGVNLTVGALSSVQSRANTKYRSFSITTKSSAIITVNLVFSHTQIPFPATSQQNDNQLVRYFDNHFFFSAYPVASQKTSVKLPSARVESFTEKSPFNSKGNGLVFGPYSDVAPYSHSALTIHFENNSPFLTVKTLEKEVEISHWGNAAIEETYEWVHSGAKLLGEFSRYDYQRNPNSAPSAIRLVRQYLPADAADVYYRDEIGNISTSHVREETNRVVVDLIPRFPLFGGWKTTFYMGYNLPLKSVLSVDSKSGKYSLAVNLCPGFENEVPIDELTVRFILPEGSTGVEITSPFNNVTVKQESRFTYLDTSGRPVHSFVIRNVVSNQPNTVVVSYSFGASSLLHEPFLLIGGFFAFFLIAMVAVRFRLSISSNDLDDQKKEKIIRGLLVDLKGAHSKLNSHFDSLLNATKKYSKLNKQQIKSQTDPVKVLIAQGYSELLRIKSGLEELDADLASQLSQIIAIAHDKEGYVKKLVDQELAYLNKEVVAKVYETTKNQIEGNFKKVEAELSQLVADLTDDISQ